MVGGEISRNAKPIGTMRRLKTRDLLPNIFPLIISALTTASISLRNKGATEYKLFVVSFNK
ncbi:hypothetical protein CASFOL_000472 [Castilleja foliolosa]|uniref:Uncharacterized protein n=1 Tax=Castilleja foliolosa TaxID=1961234 RepID=A0ABD3EPD3_9LAMI